MVLKIKKKKLSYVKGLKGMLHKDRRPKGQYRSVPILLSLLCFHSIIDQENRVTY